MPDNQRGKALAKSWGLSVRQALYRKTGDWYHRLTKFPGALLDADGYVIFDREGSFQACPQLRIGKDPTRHGGWVAAALGIKAIPGYVCVAATHPETDGSIVESLLRPRVAARGQAWGGSAEGRKAIESFAMDLAARYYRRLWPEVLDVSATKPFDLLCREGDRELRVEVKGTTSLGLSVLLTRNEVRHAQANNGCMALFVVSDIVASVSGCKGGTVRIFEPWDIQDDELEPVAFECRLNTRRDHGTQATLIEQQHCPEGSSR
jgi:5-methylcytosine-specific restriction protein A